MNTFKFILMKLKNALLFISIFMVLVGCKKNNSVNRNDSFIVGEWKYTRKNGETGKSRYDSNHDCYDWVDGIGETEYQYRGKYELKTDSIIFSLDDNHDGVIEGVVTNYYKTNSDKTVMSSWGYLVNVNSHPADRVEVKQ